MFSGSGSSGKVSGWVEWGWGLGGESGRVIAGLVLGKTMRIGEGAPLMERRLRGLKPGGLTPETVFWITCVLHAEGGRWVTLDGESLLKMFVRGRWTKWEVDWQ